MKYAQSSAEGILDVCDFALGRLNQSLFFLFYQASGVLAAQGAFLHLPTALYQARSVGLCLTCRVPLSALLTMCLQWSGEPLQISRAQQAKQRLDAEKVQRALMNTGGPLTLDCRSPEPEDGEFVLANNRAWHLANGRQVLGLWALWPSGREPTFTTSSC